MLDATEETTPVVAVPADVPSPGAPAILKAPPQHPRVNGLIRLELAKMEQRKRLAEIEAERLKDAEPVALEIGRLEAEEATIKQAHADNTARRLEVVRQGRVHLEVQEQIRIERLAQDERLRLETARLEAEEAELATAAQVFESGRALAAKSLLGARERFADVRTTSTGRSIERTIAKIERQQETIVARNPGARWYRIEMAINDEAERLGFHDDVRAVSAALKTDEFGKQISEKVREAQKAKKALPSELELYEATVAILRSMGVNCDSVEITVICNPKVISIKSRGINDEARDLCMQSISMRQSQAAVESVVGVQVEASAG